MRDSLQQICIHIALYIQSTLVPSSLNIEIREAHEIAFPFENLLDDLLCRSLIPCHELLSVCHVQCATAYASHEYLHSHHQDKIRENKVGYLVQAMACCPPQTGGRRSGSEVMIEGAGRAKMDSNFKEHDSLCSYVQRSFMMLHAGLHTEQQGSSSQSEGTRIAVWLPLQYVKPCRKGVHSQMIAH